MTTQLYKDPNILNLLEWPLIEQQFKQLTHFASTVNQRILTLKDTSEIENCYEKTDILIQQLNNDELYDLQNNISNLSSNEHFSQNIKRLAKDAILDLTELNQIAILIEILVKNYRFLTGTGLLHLSHEQFTDLKRNLTKNFLNEFRTFVTVSNDIDYLKHPMLKRIFLQITDLEDQIRKKIGSLKNNEFSSAIQYDGLDILNDRYVVPIRSDHYKSNYGLIVNRSDSGNTLFVEPVAIKDMNYKRLELELELKKEISNLSIRFSRSLSNHINELELISESVLAFDHFHAIARFAFQKSLTRPVLVPTLNIVLKDMFHPLIINPVKNDLTLSANNAGLIISGPNTGGKTAALKTVMLIMLFAKNGLYVPAKYAELHLYKNLFYFGNDGQNLPDGLSSFAAEVLNYTDLFNNLDESNLIIIDEIFNSTSSEEASALAISLLNELIKIGGSHIIVSTHHQMLKTFIHQDHRFLSAHVGFDSENHRPTYKLIYGLPGSSQALTIFKLLTLENDINKHIYESALKILDKKMVSYENLLESISKKESELDKILLQNKELNQQLSNQKNAMEGVLKLKLDDRIEEAEKKINRLIEEAKEIVSLSKKNEVSVRTIDKKDYEIKTILNEIQPEKKSTNEIINKYAHLKSPRNYNVEEDYFSTFLGQKVKLKDFNLNKNIATVTKGTITIMCPLDSLKLLTPEKYTQPKVQVSFQQETSGKLEYDCRGMRLDEFTNLVEIAASDLLANKVPFITIIHGHGTGVLKNWLRNYLKNIPELKVMSNESGNDGETKITLS